MGTKPNIRYLKGKEDVKGLVNALGHEDPRIRSEAVKALSEIGDASTVTLLLKAVGNDSARSAAIRSLTKIGEPAVMPLIEALKTKTEPVLSGIIEALGNIGDQRAIEPLEHLLREHILTESDGCYSGVSGEAVTALGRLGEKAADAIKPALREGNFLVREKAVKALGNIGGERAANILIQALKYEEIEGNVTEIQRILTRLKGNVTKDKKGECPICGTNLKFWDATEVKCYFCGANLRVEQGQLVEQVATEVADSAKEKVIVYLHGLTSTNFVWPSCCCLCLTPVAASDYYRISAITGLSMTAVAGHIEQETLQMETKVPYCKDCRHKVKKPFGHREQEAVSMDIKAVGWERRNVELTLTFRNPQYAHLFRQANNELIREGKEVSR